MHRIVYEHTRQPRNGFYQSTAAFQNGRFVSQHPGEDASFDACRGGKMYRISNERLQLKDLMEDGTLRGLCEFYAIWDLYYQYVLSEQSMLQRRSALLLQYEHSNRNWDKAKAHKKDEVRDFTFIHKNSWELLFCRFCWESDGPRIERRKKKLVKLGNLTSQKWLHRSAWEYFFYPLFQLSIITSS